MAYVFSSGKGRYAIQFTNHQGKRPTIRMGKCDKRYAEDVARKIEHVVACQLHNHTVDVEVAVTQAVNELVAAGAELIARHGTVAVVKPCLVNA